MSFHYVYILESLTNREHFYVGLTDDLHERLRKHNAGEVAEPFGCKSRVADQPSLVERRLGRPACG